MNYFYLLGLKECYLQDSVFLRKSYIAKQKQHHPDVGGLEKIQLSANINKAYNILKNPLTRAEYLLELAGVNLDNFRNNPEILMESLEMRENPDVKSARIKQTKIMQNLSKLFAIKDYENIAKEIIRLKFIDKFLKTI